MRGPLFWLLFFAFLAALVATPAPQMARTRVADGFDFPVGKPDAKNYYMSRGFLRYHPGEDWNGIGGGNTDLGDPVYSIGNGLVVFARDARRGWGNVVIVRHAYIAGGKVRTIDSFYAHLERVTVREGQQVLRGTKIGTIGTNRGMYTAHLHFEIRHNLSIGTARPLFRNDTSNYHVPTPFIRAHRQLQGTGRAALVPVNTFVVPNRHFGPPVDETRWRGAIGRRNLDASNEAFRPRQQPSPSPTPSRSRPFRINRFEDLNSF